MTQRSIIVGVERGGSRAWAETRTLLDYAGHHRPPEGGQAEARSLSASNLSLTLNTALSQSPAAESADMETFLVTSIYKN